jgi:multisubunit Na+/H+ antiporter MnhB subunit
VLRVAVASAALTAYACGVIGFSISAKDLKPDSLPAALLHAAQLFVLNVPPEEITHWLGWVAALFAPIVLATAAIGVRALIRLANNDTSSPVPTATSPIFKTGARTLMPLLLLFAVFLLWRGHNDPGGGFVGGLVAAAAFALYLMAYGVHRARRALIVRPMTLLGAGLLVALVSSIPAALRGQPFLTAQWIIEPLTLGTPVLFDIGVFLVVTGVVLMMIFSLAEES